MIPRIEPGACTTFEILGQTAVRIPTGKSSGSGTIVRLPGQTYTVLTN
ncbi:hypothetical protein [Microcoleus sp. D3_18a_C4]